MYAAPTRCPVCRSELSVTRLHCSSCDTSIEGKINRMEQELGLSYPTIRNRLHEVIRTLGFEPGKDEVIEISPEKRSTVLEDLELGKISPDEAMRLLRGEEA